MIIDEVEDVNSIMNQLNLTDILKTLHRTTFGLFLIWRNYK